MSEKEATALAAYARHRRSRGLPGGSHQAVRKAIDSGRLIDSVAWHNGRPKILDVELADHEWEANRQQQGDDAELAAEAAGSYKEHQTRHRKAQADLAELELARRSGELVRAADVAAAWAEQVLAAKTKLLGIPSRLRQQLPSASAAAVGLVEDLIREALDELSESR